jgi:hypothetical protein
MNKGVETQPRDASHRLAKSIRPPIALRPQITRDRLRPLRRQLPLRIHLVAQRRRKTFLRLLPRLVARIRLPRGNDRQDPVPPPQRFIVTNLLVHPARLRRIRRADDNQIARRPQRILNRPPQVGRQRQLIAVPETGEKLFRHRPVPTRTPHQIARNGIILQRPVQPLAQLIVLRGIGNERPIAIICGRCRSHGNQAFGR